MGSWVKGAVTKKERSGAASLGLRDQTPWVCSISGEWDLSWCLAFPKQWSYCQEKRRPGGNQARDLFTGQWTTSLGLINPFRAAQA